VIELPTAQAQAPGQTELPLGPREGGKFTFRTQQDGAVCGNCGWTMIRSGTCYKCENCGSTSGCS
jgi:ribonucleoside-diphosphate reductase alpha chain